MEIYNSVYVKSSCQDPNWTTVSDISAVPMPPDRAISRNQTDLSKCVMVHIPQCWMLIFNLHYVILSFIHKLLQYMSPFQCRTNYQEPDVLGSHISVLGSNYGHVPRHRRFTLDIRKHTASLQSRLWSRRNVCDKRVALFPLGILPDMLIALFGETAVCKSAPVYTFLRWNHTLLSK